MFRFFFFITMYFFSGIVFAEWENNLTSPRFKIDLGPMDPMHPNGQVSIPAWSDALVMVLGKIAELLLFAIPLIAGISFLVAGYYFIISSGNSEKATQAKVIIKWNLVAMAVAFFSYGLVNMVLYIMNIK